jgi:hypothetical protein
MWEEDLDAEGSTILKHLTEKRSEIMHSIDLDQHRVKKDSCKHYNEKSD